MVKNMLSQNPVIQKSLRRLRNMGLKIYVQDIEENTAMVVIDNESIIKCIKRLMEKQITYVNHHIQEDKNKNVIIVWFWKGEKPPIIKQLELEEMMKVKQ